MFDRTVGQHAGRERPRCAIQASCDGHRALDRGRLMAAARRRREEARADSAEPQHRKPGEGAQGGVLPHNR